MPLSSPRFEENVGAAVPAAISVSVATTNCRSETGSHVQASFLRGRVMQAGRMDGFRFSADRPVGATKIAESSGNEAIPT